MISRVTLLAQLAVFCIGLNVLFPGQGLAQQPRTEKATPSPPAVLEEEVPGWGYNEEKAVQNALNRASALIGEYLQRQSPPFLWRPNPEYVLSKLADGKPQRREELDKDVVVGDNKIRGQCWTVSVRVTPQRLEGMRQQDNLHRLQLQREERQARSAERMALLAKALAAVLACLLAVAAYLRVDEWTRGFYSRRLAVTVAILVGVAVLAMCVAG
jgi:hypothetical protein